VAGERHFLPTRVRGKMQRGTFIIFCSLKPKIAFLLATWKAWHLVMAAGWFAVVYCLFLPKRRGADN